MNGHARGREGPSWDSVSSRSVTRAVVLCILGLLTVNAYLYHDGVSEFTLLRPRFVNAGWWVALVLTTALLLVVLVSEEVVSGMVQALSGRIWLFRDVIHLPSFAGCNPPPTRTAPPGHRPRPGWRQNTRVV